MHKRRKSIRLKDYDYSLPGYYFVTICAHDRIHCLGDIIDGKMVLNLYGKIVREQWTWLSEQYSYLELDQWVIMPNHVHGILHMVGNGRDRSLHTKIKTLSELIGAFKTTSSKRIHQAGLLKFRWQKSFYDHIIRNEINLNRIREYIINNPSQWETGCVIPEIHD